MQIKYMIKQLEVLNNCIIIAEQWDCNASYRFRELNSGQDYTYKNVLCPVLYKLLNKTSQGQSVLDVGCGLGFLSDYLHKHGYDVTGIDIASSCISIAKNTFRDIKFHAKNIIDFENEEVDRFDACIANMFFHNVPNVKDVSSAIFSLLKPGGVLIGCLPHPVYWFERRTNLAQHFYFNDQSAYLMPFKIRGSAKHPSPFIYFHRNNNFYWQIFKEIGFNNVQAVVLDKCFTIPNDLVFFIAKKKNISLK